MPKINKAVVVGVCYFLVFPLGILLMVISIIAQDENLWRIGTITAAISLAFGIILMLRKI